MHARRLASLSSAHSMASLSRWHALISSSLDSLSCADSAMSPSHLRCKDSCLCSWTLWAARLLSWGCDWQQTLSRSRLLWSLSSRWFMLCSAFIAKDTSVNLQVAELEQHTYGMTGIGRGVTKEGLTYHIYTYISFAQFIPVYVGLAQAHPNKIWGQRGEGGINSAQCAGTLGQETLLHVSLS